MRLYTYERNGEQRIGAEHDNQLVDLKAASEALNLERGSTDQRDKVQLASWKELPGAQCVALCGGAGDFDGTPARTFENLERQEP